MRSTFVPIAIFSDVENIEEAKKLMAKFSKKKSKDDDMAFLKVTVFCTS